MTFLTHTVIGNDMCAVSISTTTNDIQGHLKVIQAILDMSVAKIKNNATPPNYLRTI